MKDEAKGVVIGCFGGFWGDSMHRAVGQFVHSAEADSIDYLVSDYLAEVTMCILAKKRKGKSGGRPGVGFIDDFVTQIWRPYGAVLMQKKIKVIVNAGGLDPAGLKSAIEAASRQLSVDQRPVVAAVVGDDVMGRPGLNFYPFQLDGGDEQDTIDRPLHAQGGVRPLGTPLSANAYLGCGGIVAALREGAHVIVTGRVVDSALVLGPLVHEFKWSLSGGDWDRLAAGTLAGHLIECGAQCTGGNFTDWELALQLRGRHARFFENIAFPLIEARSDGSFTLTKPSGTGGLVSRLSVSEQLVYEIGDPAAYIVADVVVDLTAATVEEVAPNRTFVSGVRGLPPTGKYKVSATYADGFMAHFLFCIAGPGALFKARAAAVSVLRRATKDLAAAGKEPFIATRIEYLGARELTVNGGDTKSADTIDEVVIRISAHHKEALPLMRIASHIPSISTGMSPGMFGLSNARTTPSEAVVLRSALVAAEDVVPSFCISGREELIPIPSDLLPQHNQQRAGLHRRLNPVNTMFSEGIMRPIIKGPTVMAPLFTVACCRSGDKADAANVGVVCRDAEYFPYLLSVLTPERLRKHLEAWLLDALPRRYVLPGIAAMNFVLPNVLGGGGAASLKVDKQGKSIGSLVSGMLIELPRVWVETYEGTIGARKKAIRAKL